MTSADLERLTRLYPGAIGRGVIEGSQHVVRSQLRLWEKRGEVIGLRRFEQVDRYAGTTRIPYVRLKTVARVRRDRLMRVALLAGVGVFTLGVACWLLWEVRYELMAAAGMSAVVGLFFWLWPHWSRGCAGLHCSGCKG